MFMHNTFFINGESLLHKKFKLLRLLLLDILTSLCNWGGSRMLDLSLIHNFLFSKGNKAMIFMKWSFVVGKIYAFY